MRLILTLLALLVPATALADDDARYSAYYGDGIRAYAESRYDEALTNLYRALAVKQTPFALKLIVRSHDFQGHCSARDNAATLLHDLFPNEEQPPAQRCATTGQLHIVCDGSVRVDDAFEAPCGASLSVPTGEHDLVHTTLGRVLRVMVEPNTVTSANLASQPQKWFFDRRHQRVVQLPERWIRPDLLVDPDMPRTFEWKHPTLRR